MRDQKPVAYNGHRDGQLWFSVFDVKVVHTGVLSGSYGAHNAPFFLNKGMRSGKIITVHMILSVDQ